MTDREKAIVMAHTGICMLAGDKFQIFHKYVEDIMGRPVWTHDIGWLENEIKEKSKADFIALCADEDSSEKPNKWIPVSERLPKENETVIASTKYGVCPEAKYTKENGWHWVSESGVKNYWTELEDVEAWMPLPKRYKAEGGKE